MSESPPVLCTLLSEAWKNESKEERDLELEHASSCYALHDSFLCWDRTPCVVISKGCSSENIVYILVHESIHHTLLWINGEGCKYEKPPEHIVELMEDDGIVLEELLV